MTVGRGARTGRRASVSIDLDPLWCYHKIHSLAAPPVELRRRILERCVPRYLDSLAAHDIRATFFVVAQELEGDSPGAARARALVGEIAAQGHEVANHSLNHLYELGRQESSRVLVEIARAHELLCEASGTQVVGFRAPGYDLSPTMLQIVADLGYTYDSSLFPAPAYYAAKATVMGILRAVGRPSGAVLTDPRGLFASPLPYRPSLQAPWRKGDAPLIELPIAVTRGLRLPAIGTNLLAGPRWLRKILMQGMAPRSFFNFELHGIDLIDALADEMPAQVVARQPDLRVPLADKTAAFDQVLRDLKSMARCMTLADAAAELAPTLPG